MKEMISSLQLRSYPLDRKRNFDGEASGVPKRKRTIRSLGDGKFVESDAYCWICHCDGSGVCCELCPRLYHIKCLPQSPSSESWVCLECQKIIMAETVETRPLAMQSISVDTLCILLKYVLQRMKLPETKPFHQPVDCGAVPSYTDYVFHPMDFATIDKNIKKKFYGSPEAFVADFKWILHNCVVFNGKNHSLTTVAKTIVKMCCHEVNELLICPDCYLNSCIKDSDDWFCEPCRIPHTLVWAKMKGYPYWPAKVLREDNNGQVDVRFFGEHDRAWVPLNQVFLLSINPPSLVPKKTKGYDEAKVELIRHVQLLREKSHDFTYAPDKIAYESKMSSSLIESGSCANTIKEMPLSSDIQINVNKPDLNVINTVDNLKKKKTNKYQLKRRLSSRLNNTKQITKFDGDDKVSSIKCPKQNDHADESNGKYEKIVLKINKMHILPMKNNEDSSEYTINNDFDMLLTSGECQNLPVKVVTDDSCELNNKLLSAPELMLSKTSDKLYSDSSIDDVAVASMNENVELYDESLKTPNNLVISSDDIAVFGKIDIDFSKYHIKLLANMQELVSDLVQDIVKSSPNLLKIIDKEVDKVKASYSSELEAFKHSTNLQFAEMLLLCNYQKSKIEQNKKKEMSFLKTKIWCSYCCKEAKFNCCPGANYCDFSCQEKHWNIHKKSCATNT